MQIYLKKYILRCVGKILPILGQVGCMSLNQKHGFNPLICQITLAEAQKNLMAQGYAIEFSDDGFFSTDYKKSDFEGEKSWITGENVIDYHRKFIVWQKGDAKVAFLFKYRSVHLATGASTLKNPEARDLNTETLNRIRSEVCRASKQDSNLGKPH